MIRPTLYIASIAAFLAIPTTLMALPQAPEEAAPTGLEWQQEQNLQLNKEAPRASFMSFSDLDSALKILPENSAWWRSLDGDWKFNWAKDPDSRPKDFYKLDFDASKWANIRVPSSWQQQGYGVPLYSNQAYPFERNWPSVMDEPKNKAFTSYLHRNPVGSYRRDFEVPSDWDGREVYVQFDGVDSFFYLWINGKYVGFSKDSRNPALFDISPYLQKGKNVIAAEVYRHSDGAYLECQDMFRLSGIFRTVAIFSLPKVHIRDFFVNVNPVNCMDSQRLPINHTEPGDVKGDWRMLVDVDVQNLFSSRTPLDGYSVSMALYNEDNQLVDPVQQAKDSVLYLGAMEKTLRLSGMKNFKTSLMGIYASPKLWSAETPNLYTLVLTLKDKAGKEVEMVSSQVGFRNVVIKDNVFLINGQPVKLKGVNRHETNPSLGHTVTREQAEKEVAIMKRGNINHVRNSHYPATPYFYYLCNKNGIYVQDEANIESHGYYYDDVSLSHPVEWMPAHIDRIMNMVERNKNNPCVVMWSLGNEAGPGRNFQAAEKMVKSRDMSRPTHYERNNAIADVGSNQYPSITWTQEMAKNGKDGKLPFYISEYAHNMMNAMGNLVDYWDAIESSDYILGGAIWDWVDQGMYKTMPNGEKMLCYGGDFGDQPNSGQFVFNGVMLSDLTPEPGYFEVKKVYQNISVKLSPKEDNLVIFNKNFFISLDDYDIKWSLAEDGKEIKAGTLDIGTLAPRQTKEVPLSGFIPESLAPQKGKEYTLRIDFTLKADKPWAKKGYIQAYEQVNLTDLLTKKLKEDKPVYKAPTGKLTLSADQTTITGDDFSIHFDPKTGSLDQYSLKGKNLLKTPMIVNALRCASSNEPGVMEKLASFGFRNMKHEVLSSQITAKESVVTIKQSIKIMGAQAEVIKNYGANTTTIEASKDIISDQSPHFIGNYEWTIYADGTIVCQSVLLPRGTVTDLLRIGYELQLPGNLANITYFGNGPYENYPDRKTASLLGIYKTTVNDSFVNYGRPEDCGNHENTRWVALTDDAGDGLLFATTQQPFAFSALAYTTSELILANHPIQLPKTTDKTVLVLASATRGLGGASCGPGPIERDIIKTNKPYMMSFSIRPVTKDSAFDTIRVPEANLDKTMITRTDTYTVKNVSSQELGDGDAEKALDNDPGTIWHSEYNKTVTKHPHTLDIDLGKMQSFSGMTYLPRQNGGNNGMVAKYSIGISKNGKTWTTVAEGNFPNSHDLQKVIFAKPVEARYLRFKALSEISGKDYATVAELDIIKTK
ncbi:MAG: glycoside hydrolase family 2 TIM barrel-domain containing protein [Akkermansia sp.]